MQLVLGVLGKIDFQLLFLVQHHLSSRQQPRSKLHFQCKLTDWGCKQLLQFYNCSNFGRLVNVSAQYLIDCNRNAQTGNFGCSGGSIASAWEFIVLKNWCWVSSSPVQRYMNIQYSPGIPSWETYPYQENVTHQGIFSCRYKSSTSVGKTTGYGRIPSGDEETLARVVATTTVVCAMNSELDTFAFYK